MEKIFERYEVLSEEVKHQIGFIGDFYVMDFEYLQQTLDEMRGLQKIINENNFLKLTIKPKEERLSELLFGLKEEGFDKKGYFYSLLYYNRKTKELYVSDKLICSVFEKEFNMESSEIERFLTKYVVDVLNIKVKKTFNDEFGNKYLM